MFKALGGVGSIYTGEEWTNVLILNFQLNISPTLVECKSKLLFIYKRLQ